MSITPEFKKALIRQLVLSGYNPVRMEISKLNKIAICVSKKAKPSDEHFSKSVKECAKKNL